MEMETKKLVLSANPICFNKRNLCENKNKGTYVKIFIINKG